VKKWRNNILEEGNGTTYIIEYILSYAICYIVIFAECEGNIGWEENIEMKNVFMELLSEGNL